MIVVVVMMMMMVVMVEVVMVVVVALGFVFGWRSLGAVQVALTDLEITVAELHVLSDVGQSQQVGYH